MATGLNDKNIKQVLGKVGSQGFTTKFWREYRSKACSGCGVAKALDGLGRLGIGPDGSPKGVKAHDIKAVTGYMEDLQKAMTKARSKCGKRQDHSKQLCDAYLKKLKTNLALADNMAERFLASSQPGAATDPRALKSYDKLYLAAKKEAADAADEIKDIKSEILTAKKMMTKAMEIWKKAIKGPGEKQGHHDAAKRNLGTGFAKGDLRDNHKALKEWDKDLRKVAGKLPKDPPGERAHDQSVLMKDITDGLKVIKLLIKDADQCMTFYKKGMKVVETEEKKTSTPG